MNDTQIKEIQTKLKEVIIYFDEFCKKNSIEYALSGGSALGAIRHKGFIPWDDDFDVIMTKENYDKFLTAAKNSLDTERFYLQEEGTQEWPLYFTKLRMNGTTFIEESTKNRNIHHGFFMDVFCMYSVSNNILIRLLQYFSARVVVAKTLALRGYDSASLLKRYVMKVCKFIVSDLVESFLFKIINLNQSDKTKYVANLFTNGNFKKNCYPRDFIGKPRLVQFEDIMVPVGENVDKALSLVFGDDYMEIPSMKTRNKYPTHVMFYDTEVDFKEYKGKEYLVEKC